LVEQQLQQRRVLQLQDAGGWVGLAGPVQIQAPQGLRWQGGEYAGPFRLQADALDRWTLVEQVPLERYLLGVVPHEIGAGSPAAALGAQAVLGPTGGPPHGRGGRRPPPDAPGGAVPCARSTPPGTVP